ncbi:hypothetical protein L9F63_022481, partial [Diploptera punctata]
LQILQRVMFLLQVSCRVHPTPARMVERASPSRMENHPARSYYRPYGEGEEGQ